MRGFICSFGLLLLLTLCGKAEAKEVSVERAQAIAAERLYGDMTRTTSMRLLLDSGNLFPTSRSVDTPSFYIFTPDDGRGFVIVAGDDAIRPILGYSEQYRAGSITELPDALRDWLTYVDRVVCYVRSEGIVASLEVEAMWRGVATRSSEEVMLNTARWNQDAPYNAECPYDGNRLSLTGCTQTATAIIMHYFRWPASATGFTEPFTTGSRGIDVPSRDLNHSYDWDNMLDTYTDVSYTDAEAKAVAVLMADLGHAFRADYGADGTGAIPNCVALYKNFGYSPANFLCMRDNFPLWYWSEMLRSEIRAGHPVWYSGYLEDSSGHAFVLDGYNDNDYFHVNWGWGGAFDGFFHLDGLVYGGQEFDYGQYALLGMVPADGKSEQQWIYTYNWGMSLADEKVVEEEWFSVNVDGLANLSVVDFSGEARLALCDEEGNRREWVSDGVSFTLPSNYVNSLYFEKCRISKTIEEGDRLRIYCRLDGSDEWVLVRPYMDSARWEIILRYRPIADTTSMSYDKASSTIRVEYDVEVKSALYCGGEYVEDGVEITAGRMVINTIRLIEGTTYTVHLERGEEVKEFTFTINKL